MIEIWDKDQYEETVKESLVDFGSLAEEVMGNQSHTMMTYHKAVLLTECIEGLNIKPNGIYVDVTFGGGGHSREILKHLVDRKAICF